MAKSNIRSNEIKEALLDADKMTTAIQENTKSTINSILDERLADTFRKIVSESIDEDDDTDADDVKVKDTDKDQTENGEEEETSEPDTDDEKDDDDTFSFDAEDGTEDSDEDGEETKDDDILSDEEPEDSEEDGEGMDDFSKYKVGDDEYDLTNADDDDVVKVYKRLKNDDQVNVVKDKNGNIDVKDNETGAEYLLSLDDDDDANLINDEDEDEDIMGEGKNIFELTLNEDTDLDYTDDYQNDDVMTNDGVADNVNAGYKDWGSAGVAKTTQKPWSNLKQKTAPYTNEEEENDDDPIEEGTSTTSKFNDTHKVKKMRHGEVRQGAQSVSKNGEYRAQLKQANESIKQLSNIVKENKAIKKENKEIKEALLHVRKQVAEAALTNMNLANIVRLISENATTHDEKKNILVRFKNEAKSRETSKNLFEAISSELKNKKPLHESKSIDAQLSINENTAKMNETILCESDDVLESLNLMKRMERLS